MNQDPKEVIRNSLLRVYEVLKFTPEEAKKALDEFMGLIQVSIMTELLNGLSEAEIKSLGEEFAKKSPAEQQKQAESVLKSHYSQEEIVKKISGATKPVVQEYFAYLKSRGNKEVDRILAEVS